MRAAADYGRVMVKRIEEERPRGHASLAASTGWTAEEMRLVSDLGYTLAEQGLDEKACVIFEGMAALAPATAYFQSALGALRLRMGQPESALTHLNAALALAPADVAALVNRGETYLRLGDRAAASRDFRLALSLSGGEQSNITPEYALRARALLERFGVDG